ncbi:alpha/beta fold hydrolase [Curtobacterium sp. A7_M15]|uniref:alpha/beta hydrolase n=1 Tax=Curtobacterium sp. A7_M15 TaxID=3065241 RepID=UPI002737DD8E|nr:alpha/beta fold hydrolase [Curtobacterium sp. A7_M15]MDP4334313.1 alpha/beta fold hydrolase [Curtobacterium sp. A7_M15]
MATTSPITLDHGGRTLRGWQLGDVGPDRGAALFVHGFGSTDTGGQQLFVQAARALVDHGVGARSYSRLGHGTSDGDFAEITIRDEVDQVVAMIRTLAADAAGPVHVVAHSLGAVESAMAAAREPDLVRTLTLWSPAGVVVDDIAQHDQIQGKPLAPARQQGWFDFGGMALGTAFIDEVRAGLDVYATIDRYTGPAEVLHGTADQIVPVAYGRRYGEVLPGATFTAVDGADHGWSSVPWRRTLLDHLVVSTGGSTH